MRRSRHEEFHQIQDMGLIRDERDREIQREAQSRACSGLLILSQLLAAACLLRGDPAWTALLSLTFLCWAIQGLHRFGADGAKLALAAGLLSGGAALALAGWYLILGQESGFFSLGRLLAFALLAGVLISLSGLVFVALFLAALFLLSKLGRMDAARWETLFSSISTLGLLGWLGLLMVLAVALVSLGSIPLFQALGFPTPQRLALVLFAAGCARLLGRFSRRREKLLRLLLRLKPDRESQIP